MALPPHLADLEGRLASRVEDALAGFRRAIEAKLRDASDRLVAEASAVTPPTVEGLLTEIESAALDATPRREASRATAEALLDAARAFDRASTQGEVLAALLAACGRRGDRAALFLVRGESLVLFDGAGFDPPLLQGAEAPLAALGADAASIASGCLELAGAGAASARVELELPLGGAACVIPLVLRDQIAALLWVDRESEAPELAPLQLLAQLATQRLELQALSSRSATPTLYSAGGSAVRLPLWAGAVASEPEAEATPTLEAPAAAVLASSLAFEMVGDEGAAPLAAAPEPAIEPEVEISEAFAPAEVAAEPVLGFEPEAPTAPTPFTERFQVESAGDAFEVEPEPWSTPEVEAEPISEPVAAFEPEPAFELEPVEPAAPVFVPEPAFEPEPAFVPEPAFEPEPTFEPEPETTEMPALEPPPAPIHRTLELAPVVGEWGETPAAEEVFEPEPEPAPPSAPAPPAAPALDDLDLMATTRLPLPSFARFEAPRVEEPPVRSETTAPHPIAPPPAEVPPPASPVVTHEFEAPALRPSAPAPDPTEDQTLLTQRFTIFPAPAAPAPEPPPPPPPLAPMALETAPPAPAFATVATPVAPMAEPAPAPAPAEDPMDRTSSRSRSTEVAPPPDLQGPGRAFQGIKQRAAIDSPTHEEAKRLARLLISEIKLYNEEQVLEGRRNRDLYHRLKEDIDRSRQIYEERVDPAVRSGTDYFHQELVRSLAGGEARALGI